MALCGSAYCPAQLGSSGNDTEDTEENNNFETDITNIYIIAGIYLACSISAALIVAFFVDPLTRQIVLSFLYETNKNTSDLEKMREMKEKMSCLENNCLWLHLDT